MIYETPEQRLQQVQQEANAWKLRAEEREALEETRYEEITEKENKKLSFDDAIIYVIGIACLGSIGIILFHILIAMPSLIVSVLSFTIITLVAAKALQYFWNRNLD